MSHSFAPNLRTLLGSFLGAIFMVGIIGASAKAGPTLKQNPQNLYCNIPTTPPQCKSGGCSQASISLALVSIRVSDSPVGYAPPIGPAVGFHLTYNQLDAAQPSVPLYSNVGPLWTTDWLAFVTDNPQSLGQDVTLALPGGGSFTYSYYLANGTGGSYFPESHDDTWLTLVSPSPITYERDLPDGSKEIYAQSDGSAGTLRHVFLTKTVDPTGNALTFAYDAKLRLSTVTDAIGQITTLQYANAANPLLITGVTDPFGRKAALDYDSSGRLASLTDAVGMHSTFVYDGANNMTAMTTPYGTTNFTTWVDPAGANHRYVEMTDPLNHTTHAEFMHLAPGIPFSENLAPVFTGSVSANEYINYRNTFVWDGAAYARAKGNYTQAMIYHWLHEDLETTSGVLESTKAPLENRIWYNYPNERAALYPGSVDNPSVIARVLPDGTTQVASFQYNGGVRKRLVPKQNPLSTTDPYPASATDPLGRQTNYVYDTATGTDLVSETQKTATGTDTLRTLTYNTQHEPISVQDASGSSTIISYNAKGQPLAIKNPLGETTNYTYDAKGYLTTVTDADQRTLETLAYDQVGRVAMRTDSEGWMVRYQYDNLDRVTKETYPDGTSRTTLWDKLNIGSVTDRLGHTTTYTHDAAGNLTSVTDPLGRGDKIWL